MGSSGTGRFSDYSGSSPKKSSAKTGGSSNEDKCEKAFSTSLEEVATCSFFKKYAKLPAEGEEIEIVFNKPRLAAVTGDGTVIGYLPTDRNYIRYCIEEGYRFPGAVTATRLKPTPSVQVTVSPEK